MHAFEFECEFIVEIWINTSIYPIWNDKIAITLCYVCVCVWAFESEGNVWMESLCIIFIIIMYMDACTAQSENVVYHLEKFCLSFWNVETKQNKTNFSSFYLRIQCSSCSCSMFRLCGIAILLNVVLILKFWICCTTCNSKEEEEEKKIRKKVMDIRTFHRGKRITIIMSSLGHCISLCYQCVCMLNVDDAGIQMRNVDGWNRYGKFQFHSKRRKIKTISSWLWMWSKSYKRVAQKKELTKYKKTVGWPYKNKNKTIISYLSCCIFLVLGSTFTLNWIYSMTVLHTDIMVVSLSSTALLLLH